MKKIAGILALSMALMPIAPAIASVDVYAVDAQDRITITNGTEVPMTMKPGQTLAVKGIVKSGSSNITMLSVGIYNSSGKALSGGSVKPNATSYDLSRMDRYVEFNKLEPGKYTYRVFVTNGSETNYSLVNQAFMVSGDETQSTVVTEKKNATVTLSGGTQVPSKMSKGQKLGVKGTVRSESNITSVTVGVFTEDGTLVTGNKATPDSKTYDLSRLDKYVEFNKLSDGAYVYRVTASNKDFSNRVLDEQSFTVGNGKSSGKVASSSVSDVNTTSANIGGISLTGGTQIPNQLAKGKGLRVTGKLSADSALEVVTVGVFDEKGKLATGIKASPGKKTYDLNELDKYVTFNTLSDGIYYYRVTATVEGSDTATVIIQKKFAVGSAVLTNDYYSDADDDDIDSDEPVDNSLYDDDDDDGTLEDDDTDLDDDDEALEDDESNGSVSISEASNSANFNFDSPYNDDPLDDGDELNDDDDEFLDNGNDDEFLDDDDDDEYIDGDDDDEYIDGDDDDDEYIDYGDDDDDDDDDIPSVSDNVTISSVSNIPDKVAKGKGVRVAGVVKSSGSDLTTVTAGVFDASGKMVTGKTVTVNAKSYDINKIDSYVRFNDLSKGSYRFAVVVSTEGSKNIMVYSKRFTVA